ncbi:MAG: hydantoinase/oxoprolinase family protein [Gammaproteobacteria bacterium]|nr:hydantoinase/oxoprolinase family protein [Gammaproteobacteria bacterium]MDD9870933.1 hydantoinase/oxoprolinase family protein [Gammaproteobacteria bacterium]
MSPLTLGIDTGGTFTDAALLATAAGAGVTVPAAGAATSVLASAKALTTRDNLLTGITKAVDAVFKAAPAGSVSRVRLVGLSTTLATNAIVAGHGSPACLLLIGQPPGILQRADLGLALGGGPAVFVDGGHNAAGDEQAALDTAALARAVERHAPAAAAFAVAGYFAVRNAGHELRARELIEKQCGLPVTCSHELSARLSAPRRALTALLNARLIPLLGEFIEAAAAMLRATGITAPLMVVQGDGSLITAEAALRRPVETILSGPAASILGARHLAGAGGNGTAVVSDIGGTTTDIALLRGGKPVLDHGGATVGGWRTLVEAVAVHTLGLGGDSEVAVDGSLLTLGPRRAVPLCLLAARYPQAAAMLAHQAKEPPREHHGRFALRLRNAAAGRLSRSEQAVWDALGGGPLAVDKLLDSASSGRALENLRRRELAVVAALTPTDAAHILGLHQAWPRQAAVNGAKILLRRLSPNSGGEGGGGGGEKVLAEKIIRMLVRRSAHAIGAAAINSDSPGSVESDYQSAHFLHKKALDENGGALVEHRLKLKAALIGVGAAAETYYADVAARLHTKCEIPPHFAVCNAVGAVAGGIIRRVSALVTAVGAAKYRVHIQNGVKDFPALEAAARYAALQCENLATQQAIDAGGGGISVEHERRDTIVDGFGGEKIFVESFLSAVASGTPE